MGVFFNICCGSVEKQYAFEKPPFPIPPDITTVEGEDPYAKIRPQPVADIYWDNTMSQKGYVKNSALFTHFFRTITRHAVGVNYKPNYWILKSDAKKILHWENVPYLEPLSHDFFINDKSGDHLESWERGPLTMIYDGDLINTKNLNIVVTDLEEQGLNMSLLTNFLRDKLLRIDDYAAAVIAMRLPFNGRNYRPDYKKLGGMIRLSYNGLKPIYSIVSGPRDAVKSFLTRFETQAKKYDMEYYATTTVQKGDQKLLDIFKEIEIPESATRSEINMQTRKIGITPKMNAIPNKKKFDTYETSRAKERIWNLEERTDFMVDYLGLAIGANLKQIKEKLGLRIFEYKKIVPSWKNDNWLWALNIAFELPKDLKPEDLECTCKNYRYLTKVQKIVDDELTKDEKNNSKGLIEELALARWESNDEFIRKGLDVYNFNIANKGDGDKCVFCIYPKDQYGRLESSVVCFDIIVKIKHKIEIPEWVNSFNDDDFLHPELNQDKTFNFREFVNNLLKDEVIENVEYVNDELIRLPIMLFNMPFHNTR